MKPLYFRLLLLIAPLPILFTGMQCMRNVDKWNCALEEFERVHKKAALFQKGGKEKALPSHSNPHYLDQHIETLSLLLPEIKKLEATQSEDKRLAFLKSEANALRFAETEIRSNTLFREIEEKQQQSVELNEEDLKRLLCLIEGITIWPYGPKEGRPQLIIRDFSLTRKQVSPQEKTFTMAMELIKREELTR